jgi:CRP-like cAMP-binding protein
MSASDEALMCAGLAGSELEDLLRAGQVRRLPAFSLLCEEGQLASHCYILTQGTVEVAKTIDGRHQTLSKHGPGSILALMATLDGGPCRVSMRATEDVSLVEIGRDGLFLILGVEGDACPSVADQLTIAAIRRLRRATDELAQTIHRSLVSTERPGHLGIADLAMIHAGNHAWIMER